MLEENFTQASLNNAFLLLQIGREVIMAYFKMLSKYLLNNCSHLWPGMESNFLNKVIFAKVAVILIADEAR